MSDFQKNVRETLDDLRRSPTFAMSLGAKELFHSNFLAFLLESRDPGLSSLQIGLRSLFGCPKHADEVSWCFVHRELRNLDLVLVPVCSRSHRRQDGLKGTEEFYEPSGNPCVVIEAKLKALPTAKQLEEYSRLLANGATYPWEDFNGRPCRHAIVNASGDRSKRLLVLLTLRGEDPPALPEDVWTWRPVGWSDVAEEVMSFAARADKSQVAPAILQIIEDYGRSLAKLIHVATETRRLYQTSKNHKYSEFVKAILDFKELRAARLADLVGKRAYSEWLSDVKKNFLEEPVGEAFLTRAKPGLTVERQWPNAHVPDGTLRIGVQIQGYSFRRFVAAEPAWDGLEAFIVGTHLLDTWFSGAVEGLPSSLELMGTRPHTKRAERPAALISKARQSNLRVFNPEKFLYSAVDLADADVTLEDISRGVEASIQLAEKLVVMLNFLVPNADGLCDESFGRSESSEVA